MTADLYSVEQRIAALMGKHEPVKTPPQQTVLAPYGTVVLARLSAIDGDTAWQVPATTRPRLTDVEHQGHAAILYDGTRHPKTGPCVSCSRMVSKAWYIHPINHTVPACSGECVADAIESIWAETCVIRTRGAKARSLIHRFPLDEEVTA